MWERKNINYSKYYGLPVIITYISERSDINTNGILFNISNPNPSGDTTITIKTEQVDPNHKTSITNDLIDLISIKSDIELSYKKRICKNLLCDKLNEDCFKEISSFIDYEIINI